MCFIVEILKIIDLSLYIELKNSISLKFHYDYFNILTKSSIFKKFRFSVWLKDFN